MSTVAANPKLVAYCGLYCGACKAYLKGKCPGCAENVKAGWCKVRKCCIENNYTSCADCKQLEDFSKCKEYNTFMAKLFGFIFRSDRKACINRIKEIGVEQFAGEMAEKGLQSIKR